jgi:spore maturation protein CgeB
MKALRTVDRLPATLHEQVVEELARGGLWTAYSLETSTGLKAMDSPYEPRGEAKRTLLKAGCESDKSTLLLGSGSGYFSRVIVSEQLTPALCITQSRALLAANEKRLRNRFPDAEEELSIIADDDAARVWNEDIQPFLNQNPDAIIVHHPRETRAYPGFYGALDLRIAQWKLGRSATKTSKSIQRVLFVGAGALFERELITEFSRRGIEIEQIPQTDLQVLTADNALTLLDQHKPDLVLSTNCRGSDEAGLLPEACEQSGVHWATWLLDDPRYLLKPDEIEGAGRQRIGFCWDQNGVDGWQESGFQNAHVLPLATDDTLFKPHSGYDELIGRVLFVGSPRFATGFGFFAGLDGSNIALKASRALETEILRSRRPPTVERVHELLKTLDPKVTLDREARRRLPAFATQQANMSYRISSLNALASLKPIVFGTGWEGLLDNRIELRSGLDFYTELPKLYATDGIHISLTNLQMRSHPNQRPFDVGASGQTVLNDHLDSMPELFGEELAEEMVFHSEQELVEKASILTVSPVKRKELGERLRGVVVAKHTIRHRVDSIISVCEDESFVDTPASTGIQHRRP